MASDLIFKLYSDKRTVFTLQEIALLTDIHDFIRLKQQIHYFVKRGRLRNIRRGIYVKDNYSAEELACKIFVPSYISLEYVLQKSGIIFQYSSQITCISYLSREIVVDGLSFSFRKIKDAILYNTSGIIRNEDGINIASSERAFLDLLYLKKQVYLDFDEKIEKDSVDKLLLVYGSDILSKKVSFHLKS